MYLPSLMNLLMHLKPFLSHFLRALTLMHAYIGTVGYFLRIFELDLTGVCCVQELISNSVISFSFLGYLHNVARRPFPLT